MERNRTVYLLLNTFPVISETFILNQVVGLLNKGQNLIVLSLRKPDLTRIHPDFDKYHCKKRLQIIAIPDNKVLRLFKGLLIFLKLLILCPRKALKSINRKEYRTASFSLKNLYVLNHLRGKTIPLMQAHFGPNGLVAAFLKDIGIVEKFIVTFHGSDINSYPRRYGNSVYHTLYDRADRITANTRFTGEKVISNGGNPQKIRILPVGLSCEDYPEREKEPPLENNWNFLTVGRLVEKKGHIWMLKALAVLKKKGIDHFKWHIVGDGPCKADIQNLATQLDLQQDIIFHGSRDAEQVRKHLREAHIFILPSVTSEDGDMEGQGLVLQEAQATGVPVVSTLHNGIPDGVLDGESGLLVPEKDPEALARALETLIESPQLRKNMGREGSAFVRKKYDIPILSKQWIQLYQELC